MDDPTDLSGETRPMERASLKTGKLSSRDLPAGRPEPVEPSAEKPEAEEPAAGKPLPDKPAAGLPAPEKPPAAEVPPARVARPAEKPEADPDALPWSVILQTAPPASQAIGVRVHGLVMIGRADPASKDQPDLDLTPHGAVSHGVSRRHAILMPTQQGLALIDLDSTNGTWLNGISLKPGQRYRIRTGDRIEFGTLHLDVRLVGAVPTGQDTESTRITRTKPKRSE
jgi:hypothetical protein